MCSKTMTKFAYSLSLPPIWINDFDDITHLTRFSVQSNSL